MNTNMNVSLTFRRMLSLFIPVFLGLTSNGCDFLAEKLGVDYVTVPMDKFATDLPVANGSIGYSSGEVNLGSVTLPKVFEADEIRIATDQLVFTETTDTLGKTAAQNGKVRITINIQGYCAGQATLTITNSVVSAISSNPIPIGQCAQLASYHAALPASVKALLATDYLTLTTAKIREAINTAIRALKVKGTVTVEVVEGTIRGKFTLKKADVHLDF
ncbi:MAG: hypothetical protein JNN12_11160 [Bacteroidetes Order II. Incertae sedis bacterium]|nr:hypothetical protein [Bacteroidetes Order II. bacterium]